jgi:hypothetical protein
MWRLLKHIDASFMLHREAGVCPDACCVRTAVSGCDGCLVAVCLLHVQLITVLHDIKEGLLSAVWLLLSAKCTVLSRLAGVSTWAQQGARCPHLVLLELLQTLDLFLQLLYPLHHLVGQPLKL